MEHIRTIHLNSQSHQEILPDFTAEFPYRFSISEPGSFPGGQVPWHWHSALELFYIQSGTLVYETSSGEVCFEAGSGGMVNSGVLHSARALPGEPVIQLLHLFEPSLIGGSPGSRIGQKYLVPAVTDPSRKLIRLDPAQPQQAAILEKLKRSFELSRDSFGYELRLRSALSDLWLDFLALPHPPNEAGRASDEKCKAMMIYIHEHSAEPLRVGQIAAAGCCSERETYRTFQECLHTTPLEYLQSFRLQNACSRLTGSQDNITEIAESCGFSSLSYFGKVFRRAFGCTPAEYRAKWQDRTNISQ